MRWSPWFQGGWTSSLEDSQLIVELGERSYPVLFRSGGLAELVGRVHARCPTGRAVVVSDETVASLHAGPLLAGLRGAGLDVCFVTFPAGEQHKTLDTVRDLYDRALGFGADRRTPVVAFGGGVVGDVAGFVAATLLRGVPLVQVPTTVLAQVDSSVGGKTGVNHPAGKNLVGAFHQPSLVFADAAWLATLPPRELRSGLAEVVKHGAIGDPGLLEQLTVDAAALQRGEPVALVSAIRRAVEVKARVVSADEREAGQRAVLNFGHTLGHAIEAEAGFGPVSHGDAVALGMRFAARWSHRRGALGARELAILEGALDACALPVNWETWVTPAVLARLETDKKVRGECVNYILLEGLGRPVMVETPLAEVRRALEELAKEAS